MKKLSEVKQKARAMQATSTLSYSQCLESIARSMGFPTYAAYLATVNVASHATHAKSASTRV